MKTTRLHPLAEAYLGRLESATRVLPRREREELVSDLRSHLETGLPRDASEVEVRTMLDDLGAPEDIVRAAGGDPDLPAPKTWGPLETLAVLALTVGVFALPFLGPLAGIVLVWFSGRWVRREKWVATALGSVPLLVLATGVLSVGVGIGPVELLLLFLVGPVLAGVYLTLRLGKRAP